MSLFRHIHALHKMAGYHPRITISIFLDVACCKLQEHNLDVTSSVLDENVPEGNFIS
jgi:hypothetical protein